MIVYMVHQKSAIIWNKGISEEISVYKIQGKIKTIEL